MSFHKITLFLISTCFFLMLVLSGCISKESTSLPESHWLSRFLNNSSCELPCWENITPGSSTFTDSVDMLSKNTEIVNLEVKKDYLGLPYAIWKFSDNVSDGGINSDENGFVSDILLFLPQDHFLPLKEFLIIYKEVSHVRVSDCRDENFSTWCLVDIIFIDLGLDISYSFDFIVGRKDVFTITPETKIESIRLFPKGEEGYLETFQDNFAEMKRMDWHGYGEYDNPWFK